MSGENVSMQNIFAKKFGNRPYEDRTRAGGSYPGCAHPSLYSEQDLPLSRPHNGYFYQKYSA